VTHFFPSNTGVVFGFFLFFFSLLPYPGLGKKTGAYLLPDPTCRRPALTRPFALVGLFRWRPVWPNSLDMNPHAVREFSVESFFPNFCGFSAGHFTSRTRFPYSLKERPLIYGPFCYRHRYPSPPLAPSPPPRVSGVCSPVAE